MLHNALEAHVCSAFLDTRAEHRDAALGVLGRQPAPAGDVEHGESIRGKVVHAAQVVLDGALAFV